MEQYDLVEECTVQSFPGSVNGLHFLEGPTTGKRRVILKVRKIRWLILIIRNCSYVYKRLRGSKAMCFVTNQV